MKAEPGRFPGGLTEDSLNVFKIMAEDACNWSGTPAIGGNFDLSKQELGNLSDLKKKGLVETFPDDEQKGLTWVHFTESGKELAKELGIEI